MADRPGHPGVLDCAGACYGGITVSRFDRYRLVTEEELDELTRFQWWWPLLSAVAGLVLSAAFIAGLLVL